MKTDRFSDSIRRKLESIRPDFNEKDWARMQATLLQNPIPHPSGSPTAGSPTAFQPAATSMWSAQPWLMAAAVSTVVLVGVAIWQQKQINQLHQTVSQLSRRQTAAPSGQQTAPAMPNAALLPSDRQTARTQDTPAGTLNQPALGDRNVASTSGSGVNTKQPDTVYVTRNIAAPATPGTSVQERTTLRPTYANGLSSVAHVDRSGPVERTGPTEGRTKRAPAVADAQPQARSVDQPGVPDQRTDAVIDPTASPSVDGSITSATPNETKNRVEPTTIAGRRMPDGSVMLPLGNRQETTASRRKKRTASSMSPLITTDPADSDGPITTETTAAQAVAANPATQPATAYELATRQPLTMDSKDWSKALAYRARALRPVRTTVVGGAASPASQPVRQVALGFRVGIGTDLSGKVLSGTILTELLAGNHLTLGLGLGKASFAGGKFMTDHDFDRDMRQDFRRNFARGLDPRNDIINIGIRTERVQVPISLGYRIPVSQTISVVPSVGTILNLQTTQFVNFFYREPFQGFEEARHQQDLAVNLFSNLTLGTNVEWKHKHWVGQAGPLLTVPVLADVNWQQRPSFGLRARVFYQF